MRLGESLLYSTVKVVRFIGTKEDGSGTGFYYDVGISDGRSVPVLITNKHVVDGCDGVEITCHLEASPQIPSGKFVSFRIPTKAAFLHPDPEVDLWGIPLAPVLNAAENEGKRILRAALTAANIPKESDWEQFNAIEDVIMVGCPQGIFDKANNLPILRRGITASALSKRYEGRPEFLVDMACFPGSSGSPVVLLNEGSYTTESGIMFGSRFFLLGILYAGPMATSEGVVLAAPSMVLVESMMHLGNVIRASELLELEKVIIPAALANP